MSIIEVVPLVTTRKILEDLQGFFRRHWQRALRVRETLHFSEEAFHLLLAGGVGVIGGLVNLFFYYATESVKAFFLRRPGDPVEVAEMLVHISRVAVVLTPALGGFLAGLVLYWGLRLAGPQRSSNLLEVVIAGDGRLPFRAAIVKFISSLVTIGSGGSIGREGGITQLSATFASKWGQLAKWHPYRLRLLVGCGAASGIAAAYNAPISGAVFAALIVLGNFSMSLFAPLVFSSVVATMVTRSFFGIRPWYTVPGFDFTSVAQLPWFVCLGVVTGVVGAAFLKLLRRADGLFKRVKTPIYIRLALGGLVVGLLALEFPGVWGNGYVITSRILHGEYASPALSVDNIVDLDLLVEKLKHPPPTDALSPYLAAHLSPRTTELLAQHRHSPDLKLQRALVEDLNRILVSGPLYEPERFTGIQLASETKARLAEKPTGADMVRLNRAVLCEAYSGELAPGFAYASSRKALLFLAGLFLAKLLATLATVGSGAVGGVFTPTLFLGAGLGATFGLALHEVSGGLDLPVSAFAIVGMGGMLSATLHSPLLAMILVFEMSLDYSLMPPLMLACVVSILVARRLHPDSIYTEPLRQKGLEVPEDATMSETTTQKTVSDIMRAPVPPIRETTTLKEIIDRFLVSSNNFLPVVDGVGRLLGMVALQDLKEHLGSQQEIPGIIAYDLMRPPPPCAVPGQRLLDVLPLVLASDLRNVPVVSSHTENRLVGALARTEVLAIFSEVIAASRKGDA